MTTPKPARRRSRLIAPLAITAAATAALSVVASGAWFTDTDQVGGNTFASGTVDISAGPVTTAFNVSGMVPGDVVYRGIDVHNAGSLEMRYDANLTVNSGDATLASTLRREVRRTAGSACDATTFGAASGSVLQGDTGYSLGAVITDRTLAANAHDYLCVRVTLPTSATNTVAGKSITNSTFTFAAEQTKNN